MNRRQFIALTGAAGVAPPLVVAIPSTSRRGEVYCLQATCSLLRGDEILEAATGRWFRVREPSPTGAVIFVDEFFLKDQNRIIHHWPIAYDDRFVYWRDGSLSP